jgi:hypothetical protein
MNKYATITITLTAQEEQYFGHLMDAALRHGGVGILDVAVLFRGKLMSAHQEEAAEQRKPLSVVPLADVDKAG